MKRLFLFILVLCLLPAVAEADSAVFTGTSICEDNLMYAGAPGDNYGTSILALYRPVGQDGQRMRPLMIGPDSTQLADSITPGTQLVCSLEFFIYIMSGANTGQWYAVGPWHEMSSCWNSCSTGYNWGIAGADSAGSTFGACGDGGVDRSIDTIAITVVDAGNNNTWFRVDFSEWANTWFNGTAQNYGVTAQSTSSMNFRWYSSEQDSLPKWLFWEVEEEEGLVTYRHSPGGVGDRSGGTVRHVKE